MKCILHIFTSKLIYRLKLHCTMMALVDCACECAGSLPHYHGESCISVSATGPASSLGLPCGVNTRSYIKMRTFTVLLRVASVSVCVARFDAGLVDTYPAYSSN